MYAQKSRSETKPRYDVPSMADIRRLKPNGFTVASTFSGCGGSSLGYRMAGYSVLYANEFIEAAREAYSLNCSDSTVVDGRDIRTVTGEDILAKIGKSPGELDLLDGSPPCASFSTAGKRQKHWGKVKEYSDGAQRTDDLFFEFVRILRSIQPRVFVAENVSGLVKGAAKGYFLDILAALKGAGYGVECRLLDAKWLGVPQSRQRTIFIGVRSDLKVDPKFPKPLPFFYSLRDAIPEIGRPKEKIDPETDISRFAIGQEWETLRPGRASEKYFNLVRCSPDLPAPTVCALHGGASVASITHPFQKRKFSIDELKRICSFPSDFKLSGSYQQQWERLGRAVPPLMMFQIAKTIEKEILCQVKSIR